MQWADARVLAPLLTAVALAAPNCELDGPTFRAAVVDARSALQRDDIEVARHEVARITDHLGCVDFVPERRLWAELMVVMAVIGFAEGEDWESPLAAALRIRPAIDRLVGRVHPMYDWELPAEPPLQSIVSRNTLYIDGRPIQAKPPPQGWYLVQKTDGAAWNTVFQQGEPVDTAWLLDPVLRPPRLGVEVTVGVGGGGALAGQWKVAEGETPGRSVYDLAWDDEAAVYAANTTTLVGRTFRRVAVAWGDVGLRATFFSRVGLEAHGNVMIGVRPYSRYVRGGLVYAGRRWDFLVGAAVYDQYVARWENAFGHRDGVYDPYADNANNADLENGEPEPGAPDGRPDEAVNQVMAGGVPFYYAMVGVGWSPSEALHIGARVGMASLNAQMGELDVRFRMRPLSQLPEVLVARPFVSFVIRGGYGTLVDDDQRLRTARIESGVNIGATFGAVP